MSEYVTTETVSGSVRGVPDGYINTFIGVPYGAVPPLESLQGPPGEYTQS